MVFIKTLYFKIENVARRSSSDHAKYSMGFKKWLNTRASVDLRRDFDEMAEARADDRERGTIYRKGTTVQVWWTHDVLGRPFDPPTPETWTLPDEAQAIRAFTDRAA